MQSRKYPDTLIIRDLIHDLSVDEKAELEAWKSKSISNAKRYQLIQDAWQDGKILNEWGQLDLDSNWKEIITKSNQSKLKSMHFLRFVRYAAAAAILLFAGIRIIQFLSTATITNEMTTPMAYELPDGSDVWLKPASSIQFSPNQFMDDRSLTMQGEVFFEVRKDQVPFVVRSGASSIRVLGTSFNVRNHDENTEVLLLEGSVAFTSGDQSVRLVPGERAMETNGRIIKSESPNMNDAGWKTGVFDFTNKPLSVVIDQVSSYYGFQFHIEPDKKDLLVSIQLEQTPLDQFIEELAFILDVQINYQNQQLTIQ